MLILLLSLSWLHAMQCLCHVLIGDWRLYQLLRRCNLCNGEPLQAGHQALDVRLTYEMVLGVFGLVWDRFRVRLLTYIHSKMSRAKFFYCLGIIFKTLFIFRQVAINRSANFIRYIPAKLASPSIKFLIG